MTARSVSNLAAAALGGPGIMDSTRRDAVAELVARLEAAEAERDNWKASCARYLENRQAAEAENERLREQKSALLREANAEIARREAAEAQVAALTQEHEMRDEALEKFREGTDELAAQVAALTQERDEIEGLWATTQFPEFIEYWFTIGRSCSAGDAIRQLMAEKAAAEAALADTTAELRATTATLIETNQALADTRRALEEAMREQGCLCLYSRCPHHGEGTGTLARIHALAATGGGTRLPSASDVRGILRGTGQCPDCGHDAHTPGYCVMSCSCGQEQQP